MRTYMFGLAAIFLLFIFNMMGISFGWYEAIWSYDIFMHMLGGLSIGISAAAALELHDIGVNKRAAVVAAVIIAGLAWEIFEAYYGIAGGTIDTVADMINDVIGGLMAAYLIFPKDRAKKAKAGIA